MVKKTILMLCGVTAIMANICTVKNVLPADLESMPPRWIDPRFATHDQTQSPQFVNRNDNFPFKKQAETSLGRVRIVTVGTKLPPGWRIMKMEEGRKVSDKLQEMLGTYSIVGFTSGKLSGPGYGSNFQQSSGKECGELFVIKQITQ